MTRKTTLAAAICIIFLLVTPAFAHHSFANFDMDQSLTLTGVANRFE